MTYRNFAPDLLNAGRTKRQVTHQSGHPNTSDFSSKTPQSGALVGDLTRELEAIAHELGRLKAAQPSMAQIVRVPDVTPQSHYESDQLKSLIQSLKNDVRVQMRDDLDAQYIRLHEELNGLNKAIAGTALQNSFKGEISQLLAGLETLSSGNRSIQNSQDRLSTYLQRELTELQSSLNGLARGENLAKLGDRWNSLENRWTKLENKLENTTQPDSSAHLMDISARISALHDKMNDGGLESLENRLLMLAKSVDALAQSKTAATTVDFGQIDHRFDELSRAVAAINSERPAPVIDRQAFQQIENAIGLLGRKLELVGSMTGQSPSLDAIESRLNQLNDRFSELPDYFNQDPLMERLDRLADKVAAIPATSISPASIDALTQQLNMLTGEIRGNSGYKPESTEIFETLGERLGSIEERLQSLTFNEPTVAVAESNAVIEVLEHRFAQLSAYLETMQQPTSVNTPDSVDLGGLEEKLADISRQLSNVGNSTIPVSSFDRLEGQISELSHSLASKAGSDSSSLAQRFESLEHLLSQNQHALLDGARKAAETAAMQLKSGASESDNAQIVSVIAGELANLEQLTRSTNERSNSAIEGIHGALTKIAERLMALEAPKAAPVESRPAKTPDVTMPSVDDVPFAPSLEAAESDLGSIHVSNDEGMSRKPRTPSEMAQAAASDALRGLGSDDAPQNDWTPAGDQADDTPLNPGATIPDLNSILKRVRDQKKATQSEIAKDTDRKDYFSSIKRAAQAAAAEVQQIEPTKGSSSALGNLKSTYGKFKRPILIVAAAAIVAIAAMQLTSAFTTSDPEIAPEASLSTTLPSIGNETAAPSTPTDSSSPEANAAASNSSALPAAESGVAIEGTPRIIDAGQGLTANPDQKTELNSGNAAASTPAVAAQAIDPAAAPSASNSSAMLPSIPAQFGPAALVEAVQSNDAKAQFEIGRRLAENLNDKNALAESFAWFNASAAQGFAPAQYRVGNMFEKGLGVERSATDAKLWYQMAAEAGNASAMHNLAVLFASGVDGTVDNESALRWFQKAADLGVGDSQFNLGVMKGKGQGVPQDLEESYKWLAILAKSGDVEAGSKRDEVAKTMRPEQLESAKAKVELWKPQAAIAEANDLTFPDTWKIDGGATATVDVKKAVKNVQLILTKLGYDVGTPDGIMGENTRKAIRAFQKKENLAVSGEIDGPLVKALIARNG